VPLASARSQLCVLRCASGVRMSSNERGRSVVACCCAGGGSREVLVGAKHREKGRALRASSEIGFPGPRSSAGVCAASGQSAARMREAHVPRQWPRACEVAAVDSESNKSLSIAVVSSSARRQASRRATGETGGPRSWLAGPRLGTEGSGRAGLGSLARLPRARRALLRR